MSFEFFISTLFVCVFFYKNRDPKFLNDTKPNTPFHFPVQPLAAAVQDKILLFEPVPT